MCVMAHGDSLLRSNWVAWGEADMVPLSSIQSAVNDIMITTRAGRAELEGH